jgi:hypothetical protein
MVRVRAWHRMLGAHGLQVVVSKSLLFSRKIVFFKCGREAFRIWW